MSAAEEDNVDGEEQQIEYINTSSDSYDTCVDDAQITYNSGDFKCEGSAQLS